MPDYLSSSQIEMYRRCPMQYEFRYVKGLKEPPKQALMLGSAVHKSIELNYTTKFDIKKQAPKDAVMDAFSTSFEGMKHGVKFDEPEGRVKDFGYQMSKKHYEEVAPSVEPTAKPELEFLVKIPGVNKPLKGYIDIIADIPGVKNVVLDTKTSSKKKSQIEADLSGQLTAYQISEEAKGHKVGGLGLDVLSYKKSGVDHQRLLTKRTPEEIQAYYKTVQQVEKGIQSGVFPPTNNYQACSWCGFNKICPSAKVAIQNRKELDF